jgi:hypothetical protein
MNREQVAHNVAEVRRLMPELVPEIKALHDAGLIDGWRDVAYIGPPRADPPRAVAVRDMVLTSAADLKERMRKNGTL